MRDSNTWTRARGDRGASSVWLALFVSLVLMAMVALVVSAGALYVERRVLQTAAESAALAGAMEWTLTDDATAIRASAQDHVDKNVPTGASVDAVFSTEPALSPYIFRATLTETGFQPPLAGLLGTPMATITVTAAATAVEPSVTFAPECGIMLETGAEPFFDKFDWYDASEGNLKRDKVDWKQFDPETDQLFPKSADPWTRSFTMTPDVPLDYFWGDPGRNNEKLPDVPSIRFFEQRVSRLRAFNDPANSLKTPRIPKGAYSAINLIEVGLDDEFVTKKDPPPDVRDTAFGDLAGLIKSGIPMDDPRRLMVMPICEWSGWLKDWREGVAIPNADLGNWDPYSPTFFWKRAGKAPRPNEDPDVRLEGKKSTTTVQVVGFALLRVSTFLDSHGRPTVDTKKIKGIRAAYVRALTPAESDNIISWRLKKKKPKKHQPPPPSNAPTTTIPYEAIPFSEVHLVP